MIYVPVSKLAPGMVLAAPVRHTSAADHTLPQAGCRLTGDTLTHLQKFSVRAVRIHYPGFDFLDDKMGDSIPNARVKLHHSAKACFTTFSKKTTQSAKLIDCSPDIDSMITSMIVNKKHAVWAERIMEGEDELFAHCANVAYLALVIGMRIKNYVVSERSYANWKDALDLTNLGIGAMLHDLGKLSLDAKWRDVHFFDKRAHTDEYRSHTKRGFQAVQGRLEPTAAAVLLHHHQRFDGKGLRHLEPCSDGGVKPMKGHNIHIFSRIVAVANAIDGLISISQKRNLPLAAALVALQRSVFKGMFDTVVLDAALRVIPPFPLGSCIALSDGSQAIVTDLNESKPCQPNVHLFDLSSNDGQLSEEIDLAAPDAPTIVECNAQKVGKFFYTLSETIDVKNLEDETEGNSQTREPKASAAC